MTSRQRPAPRRPDSGGQERADRTRELLIDETIRCIREEGFSAASTRHIIERAGVSWGVIQYHFGDRDGLLTAVIENAVDRLVDSLAELAEPAQSMDDSQTLVESVWAALANPPAMAGLEILIAAKEMRGKLNQAHIGRLGAALAGLDERLDPQHDHAHATAIGIVLWSTPVAMMIAEMFAKLPLATKDAQKAIADLIDHHR